MSTKKLSDKVAIVTGASKGIGAGIAKQLAAAGAKVVVNYASSRTDADKVVAEIANQGGQAIAVQGNVSHASEVEQLFAVTRKTYGRVDILVNNAGIYAGQPLGQITEESFHRHFDLNVLGVILTTQEALKHFGSEGGSIVNIGSVVSSLALPQTAVYNATKASVDMLTRTFAKELGGRRIRVNSVNPGPVETEGTHAAGFVEQFGAFAALTPLGRVAQPGDIAPVVAFLASPEAGWITGECLVVSGGLR